MHEELWKHNNGKQQPRVIKKSRCVQVLVKKYAERWKMEIRKIAQTYCQNKLTLQDFQYARFISSLSVEETVGGYEEYERHKAVSRRPSTE